MLRLYVVYIWNYAQAYHSTSGSFSVWVKLNSDEVRPLEVYASALHLSPQCWSNTAPRPAFHVHADILALHFSFCSLRAQASMMRLFRYSSCVWYIFYDILLSWLLGCRVGAAVWSTLHHVGLLSLRAAEQEVAVGIKLNHQLDEASERAYYGSLVFLVCSLSLCPHLQPSLNKTMICFPLLQDTGCASKYTPHKLMIV